MSNAAAVRFRRRRLRWLDRDNAITLLLTGAMVFAVWWTTRANVATLPKVPTTTVWQLDAPPPPIDLVVDPTLKQHIGVPIQSMVKPACVMGPPELCAALAPMIFDCDHGGASACLGLAHRLDRHVPYPTATIFVYHRACALGAESACVAVDTAAPADCSRDLASCTLSARHHHDVASLEALCGRGAADACTMVASYRRDRGDGDGDHAYMLAACWIGSPLACAEVARRYDPSCVTGCSDPDAEVAAIAAALACRSDVGGGCPVRTSTSARARFDVATRRRLPST